jgi:aldehyde:ferredoxin oxidoreductase
LLGYNGKILRVNLTTGTISEDKLEEKFCRQYLGGAGFVAYYLMKELKAHIDPLGPENKLMFMTGPLVGIPISGNARNCCGCKSPLTGGITKSEVGGFWNAELRRAGYDGIIVEGRSPKPVYIWIKDGVVEIRDAKKYWGMATKETQEGIREELGDKGIKISSIGPGGENMVRFACIMNDLKEAAGRGGSGAVMGSKNLKAIAVRGSKLPDLARPDEFPEFQTWVKENRPLWAMNADFGTGAGPGMIAGLAQGNLPVNNFSLGEFVGVEKTTATAVKDTIRIGMEGCYACLVRCKKIVKNDEPGRVIDPEYGGPEYEALASLGSTCGVTDLKAICKANELCNAYSLDAISAGVAVAFAIECYEKGFLTNKDTGGLELKWGNGDSVIKAIELLAHREGIGDLIAEGTKRMAAKIGHGSNAFAMNVKGLEYPMHDPRAKAVLGLGYAINPHGADHCMNMHDTGMAAPNPGLTAINSFGVLDPLPADDLSPKKVQMFRAVHSYQCIRDCAMLCMFVPYTYEQAVEMIKAATGWNTGSIEIQKVADRVLTLFRMFNIREGFTDADDMLTDRTFNVHVGGPASKLKPYSKDALTKARDYYYKLMGWDAKGVPTPETVNALDLDWAAKV